MARAQERIEAKRRSEIALRQIRDSERAAALEHSFASGNKVFEAAKAGNEWRTACLGGPAACLLAIKRAKEAIEEGFASAEEALEVKVHASAASGAGKLGEQKTLERATLERQQHHLEGLGEPVRYDKAMSRNPAPSAEALMSPGPIPPVRMGGEQVGAEADTPEKDAQRRLDAFRQKAEATTTQAGSQTLSVTEDSVIPEELDNATAALKDQGQAAQKANASEAKASRRRKEFATQFSEESQKTFERLQSAADKESDKGESAKEAFEEAQSAAAEKAAAQASAPRQADTPLVAPTQALPIVTPVPASTLPPKGTTADSKSEESEAIDHCPNGAFICPNGNPWPKCTHPEKYDCPPAEYAAQAQKELSEGQVGPTPTAVPTKRR